MWDTHKFDNRKKSFNWLKALTIWIIRTNYNRLNQHYDEPYKYYTKAGCMCVCVGICRNNRVTSTTAYTKNYDGSAAVRVKRWRGRREWWNREETNKTGKRWIEENDNACNAGSEWKRGIDLEIEAEERKHEGERERKWMKRRETIIISTTYILLLP